jgi:hypothetical protein
MLREIIVFVLHVEIWQVAQMQILKNFQIKLKEYKLT